METRYFDIALKAAITKNTKYGSALEASHRASQHQDPETEESKWNQTIVTAYFTPVLWRANRIVALNDWSELLLNLCVHNDPQTDPHHKALPPKKTLSRPN